MKVCVVTPSFPIVSSPSRGGAATYAETLARVLLDAGVEVHVLVYGPQPPDCGHPSVPVTLHQIRLRYLPYLSSVLPNLFEAWQLYRALTSLDEIERFDIVEGCNDEGLMLFIAVAFGRRFWMRLHSSLCQHIENKGQKFTWRRRFPVWMDRIAARQTANLTTHSRAHRFEMVAEYGIPAHRIAVVPHAVDAPSLDELNATVDRQSKKIAYIGTLDRRKGIDLILRAVPQIIAEVPDTQFLIVGRDGGDSDCESWSAWFRLLYPDPELLRKVDFLGPINDEHLCRLWAHIDLVVVPSRYESFGLVVIEAFARGKPVVVTDGGALPEVASGSALVVAQSPEAIAQGVCRILADTKQATELAMQARATFESKYTLANMRNNILELYKLRRIQDASVTAPV